MNLDSLVLSDKQPSGLRMVRPIGVLALHGIAFLGNRLFAVDRAEGLLLEIDRESDNTTVLNPYQTAKFPAQRGWLFPKILSGLRGMRIFVAVGAQFGTGRSLNSNRSILFHFLILLTELLFGNLRFM